MSISCSELTSGVHPDGRLSAARPDRLVLRTHTSGLRQRLLASRATEDALEHALEEVARLKTRLGQRIGPLS